MISDNPYEQLKKSYAGITVVADVHGMHQSLISAIDWAKSRNHFIWFLGDMIDYGPGSLDVVEEVYRLVMKGEAGINIGNHERKIMRWIEQQEYDNRGTPIHLNDGNKVTTNAITKLDEMSRWRWCGKFQALVSMAKYYQTIGDFVFSHAAISPNVWNNENDFKDIERTALFGQTLQKDNGEWIRLYDWCEEVPQGKTVFVGHDTRSMISPVVVDNSNGGKIIFLDTGAGKGGYLTTADLRFTNNGMKIENFNRH